MLTFEEYRAHDALALAALVKNGDTSPEELLEVAIRRVEEVNPELNAVIHKFYDQGRAAAGQVDKNAPFAGVPFLVKDLGMELTGVPMRIGSRGYAGYVSSADSHAVKKMRRAGLVIFGKTNTPEFGLTPFTEPELFGPTRNPWNPAYSPGGSSGGSAAAVAAGIVPIATANDGGGSIRIPASCCGLFGLKPSRGRVSWAGLPGEMWSGAAVEGSLSRSVRDAAAYLDVIQGAAPGDSYIIQAPTRPYLQEVTTTPPPLRIGYTAAHTFGMTVDGACETALHNAVDALRSAGHLVEEAPLPYRKEDLSDAFLVVIAGEAASSLEVLARHLGRRVRPSDVEASTYALALLGRAFSAGDYAFAKYKWGEISRRIAAFHERYDLLVTPTLATRPIRTGALQPTATERRLMTIVNSLGLGSAIKATIGQLAEKFYGYIPWTPFANLTGQPSMSMPFHWTTEEGLPIGVMFTARLGEENVLFQLAGQLETRNNPPTTTLH